MVASTAGTLALAGVQSPYVPPDPGTVGQRDWLMTEA